MKKLLLYAPLVCLLQAVYLSSASAQSQTENGKIVESAAIRGLPLSYEDWIKKYEKRDPMAKPLEEAIAKRNSPKNGFDLLNEQTKIKAFRITYMSDGLKIRGYLLRPVDTTAKAPVLIYAPGGFMGDGSIGAGNLIELAEWAGRGYIVVTTNYRGGVGSEGVDEIGGDDVHDVMALVPLIKTIHNADTKNMFLLAESRGGLMAYRSLGEGLPVNAAAIIAGPSNIEELYPAFKRFGLVVNDLEAEKANHFCRRSAVCWPEKIKTHLLLIHGGNDQIVPVTQTLEMTEKMQKIHKPYSTVIYENDDHSLTNNRPEAMELISEYFNRYKK